MRDERVQKLLDLERAEAHRLGATAQRDAVLREQRETFDLRWGLFAKCMACGGAAPHGRAGMIHVNHGAEPCGGTMVEAGYSWHPEQGGYRGA